MSRRFRISTRRVSGALVWALGLGLFACSGSGGDVTAPDPGPQDPPPTQPPPVPTPTPTPPPDQHAGITGSYVLVQINNSQPGQLVTVANPDGNVIGLYRFDAATTMTLDPLQTFDLQLRYTDDKSQYGIDDQGEFKGAGEAQGFLALAFSSGVYGDTFTGVAGDDMIAIKYDFDGDGQLDTSFGFQRVGG